MVKQQKPQSLERVLSLLDATMINAGGIIGSGIFMVPATVAFFTGSTSLFFWFGSWAGSLAFSVRFLWLSWALPCREQADNMFI